ncbi:CMGC protein kinase [Fusarium proliferatum]|uniref:CMGC protein kinase n=1 Tax=Gibberella intermedia TaxID=948311 RepID=A0A365NH48_GIBIN|nr:CMGC protein kinase [Fusarium proliferatum]
MGLFAPDDYWQKELGQYLHPETFLEDVPPLVGHQLLSKIFAQKHFSNLLDRDKNGSDDLLRIFSILVYLGHTEYFQYFEDFLEPSNHILPQVRKDDRIIFADAKRTCPPFYDFGTSPRSIFEDAGPIKSGGSSQVFRVRIHPSHVPDHGQLDRDLAFAVKRINGTSKDYARERDAYQQLSLAQNPHPHITPLLATYRMEGKYHFVFPYADGDLAMFWRNQPRPSNDKRSLQWLGGQMRGLVDALSRIHGLKGQARDFYGRHGDVKPENILVFGSNDSNVWPRFALSDFGSSYFCTPEDRDIPKGLKHTPVYRAPEIDTAGGATQACDIWSLGCVFLEAVTWLCYGKDGISKLCQSRLDEFNSPNRDAFFQLQYDKRDGLTAKLKPEVHRLLISLRESSRSSLFIDDILYIVLEGMLKVNTSERMSAWDVLDALTQICSKLESDPAYSEPRGTSDVVMAFSYITTPFHATRSNSLTTARSQVHTQHARQRLDRTVDATYYTNATTQSLSDAAAQIGLKLRFACPYHKAGILVSVHHRACEGPGWIDVNKVKEHLFRCHLPKEFRGKCICLRCYTGFKTDVLLQAHAQQDPPCSKKRPTAVYGMLSGDQAAQLHSMKRKSSKETDEDRWFDLYRIAFPNFNRKLENISPYHESNSTSLSTLNTSTSSNGISQYRDYLRNRGAEEYATKLAKMGIDITLEATAKLLELQVKDLESFDETMREPVRGYGIPHDADHEKIGDSVPSGLGGSTDLLGQFQLLATLMDSQS